jgi:hypothetical protein
MEPDTLHRLAVVVDDELAGAVVAANGPRCAVREVAFAE